MLLLIPFLGWNTVTDLRSRRVSIGSVLLFGVLGVFLLLTAEGQSYLFADSLQPWKIISGGGFGILLLLFSLSSGGGIGRGDCMVAIVLGLYLGIEKQLLLFMTAFLLTGMLGFVLLMTGRAASRSRLPLMPFLLAGYLILLCLGIL